MTEEKYNTKDIRHIDEKNQEYIAENNRMTKENIKINEEEIMQRIMNIELMQKWDESSEDYKKRVLEYMKENEELSKLIRGTKDYAEVCSVCKDEVTIYPNISGRTDYTQNEVECRTLAQIITRKNNLEQENRELKAYKDVNEDFKKAWDELNKKYTEVLELAKTNADSNEYCLQELEKENKKLKRQKRELGNVAQGFIKDIDKEKLIAKKYRSALEEIREYCNSEHGSVYVIIDKINEVLNESK